MPSSPHMDVVGKAFQVSYDYLWNYITNPLMFPVLYPNWLADIQLMGQNKYLAETPDGSRFHITPNLNKEFGVVNFKITCMDGKEDVYRSRLIPIDEHTTVLVHVLTPSHNFSRSFFDLNAQKSILEADYENARKIVENVYTNTVNEALK